MSSVVVLVAALMAGVGTLLAVLCAAALVAAVIVAVHHAEVARQVGWNGKRSDDSEEAQTHFF